MLDDLERQLDLPGLERVLGPALDRSADPERARPLARDALVASAAEPNFASTWRRAPEQIARALSCLCGAAPFFAPLLVRYPSWLAGLAGEDLLEARTAAVYQHRLQAALQRAPAGEEGAVLRRFKYYELARITVRELSADIVPEDLEGEILEELSHLADALLDRALATVTARIEAQHGPPVWSAPGGETNRLGFCVLGLGKLGSEELNYSSDVDLIYVCESQPQPASGGPSGLSPAEYFTRVARDFGRLAGDSTGDGLLYRIDLDLRPEGGSGPLVASTDMLANYYELRAATWEKAAFMKARPVAGDLNFGWRAIRAVNPMIYRSSMDFAGVAAIREMKEKIRQAKGRSGDSFNVKLGSGGIRDVEFVAQALQLLHGGRIPQVRGRSTQGALESLAEVGVLPDSEARTLLASYRFLRRTENRLQMESERQVYNLPEDRAGLTRLARAMGFLEGDPVAGFETALETHRGRIRRIFRSLFDERGAGRIAALFARDVPHLFAHVSSRAMIEHLAERFAREIEASTNPERALNNLDRFLRGVGGRRFYYELLIDRPELVSRLSALFAASEYFSGYLATHPRLIEPIFSDPNVLLLSRDELCRAFAAIRRDLANEGGRDDVELELDALRLFHNRELINVGLLDMGGKISTKRPRPPSPTSPRSASSMACSWRRGSCDGRSRNRRRRSAPESFSSSAWASWRAAS